ncbi:hypothetical protein ACQVTQ_30150, partial [Bacillus mycoides]
QLHSILTDILAITEKLKDGTYEKVMAKSDLQLGIESLQRIKQWGFLPIPSKRYIKEYLSKLYWFKRYFFSNIIQMRCGFLLRL